MEIYRIDRMVINVFNVNIDETILKEKDYKTQSNPKDKDIRFFNIE